MERKPVALDFGPSLIKAQASKCRQRRARKAEKCRGAGALAAEARGERVGETGGKGPKGKWNRNDVMKSEPSLETKRKPIFSSTLISRNHDAQKKKNAEFQ